MESEATEVPAVAAAGDAAVVAPEVQIVEKELPKIEEAEKACEKTPETPVTEPLTNGSSAPESPKEEIRQNGDSVSIEEPAPMEVEVKVPEVAKPEEKAEAASVDALPMNGLKIEDAVKEEVKPVVDVEVPTPEAIAQKIEEVMKIPETVVPELIEEISPVIADAEVCVAAAAMTEAKSAEAAPPLPSSPPPSSLTAFAESTMASPLVDPQVVGSLPAVDVDASLSSVSPPAPVSDLKDEVQQIASDASAQLVCDKTSVDNIETALLNENALGKDSPSSPNPASESSAALNLQISSDANAPAEPSETSALVDNKTNEPASVDDNLAVVSSDEITTPAPSDNVSLPVENVPSDVVKIVEELDVRKATDVEEPIPAPILAMCPAKPSDVPVEATESPAEEALPPPLTESINMSAVSTSDLPLPPDTVESQNETVETTSPIKIEDIPLPPPVEESFTTNASSTDSPILQRGPSDPDVSETTIVEPSSDSFPPPPPPESCPESMTELSVSESLPPPLSECSPPDTVLNSPTSESAELPSVDEAKSEEGAQSSQTVVTMTTLPEISIPAPAEIASESVPPTVAAEVAAPSAEVLQQVVSAEAPQVKSVCDVVGVPPEISEVVATNFASQEVAAAE